MVFMGLRRIWELELRESGHFDKSGMFSTVSVLCTYQSACVSILVPRWQDSSAWRKRKLNCIEKNTEWGLNVWQATTGDSADLAVCNIIRCANSAGLFFSPYCSEDGLLCFGLSKVSFLWCLVETQVDWTNNWNEFDWFVRFHFSSLTWSSLSVSLSRRVVSGGKGTRWWPQCS